MLEHFKRALWLLPFSCIACNAAHSQTTIGYKILETSPSCYGLNKTPEIQVINDTKTFNTIYAKAHAHIIGKTPAITPDFKQGSVVVVHRGFLPTGGYSIRFKQSYGILNQGTFFIDAELVKPQNEMTSPVRTLPCVFLQIYEKVQTVIVTWDNYSE